MSVLYQRSYLLAVLACFFLSPFILAAAPPQQKSKSWLNQLPPELRATDPQVRSLVESGYEKAGKGDFDDAFSDIKKALEISRQKGLVADIALAEAMMGLANVMLGKWEQAEEFNRQALQHAIDSSNRVLQADVLVSLAVRPRIEGNVAEALRMVSKALELAVSSKNLFIQSRVLAELADLQLLSGNKTSARESIQKALEIDELNDYYFKPLHQVYLARVMMAESEKNIDGAIQQLETAQKAAIEKENFLVLVMATNELGKAYLAKGEFDKTIELLEQARSGELAKDVETKDSTRPFKGAVALPLYRVVLLSTLAEAYRAAKKEDRALSVWNELYVLAKEMGFSLAEAGVAHEIAQSNQVLGKDEDAIKYYEIAAAKWRTTSYASQLRRSLLSLTDLLTGLQRFDEALPTLQELNQLGAKQNDLALQFTALLNIGRAHYHQKRFKESEKSFLDAKLLIPALNADKKLDQKGVEKEVLTLYFALSSLYHELREPLNQLIVLEKALVSVGFTDDREKTAGLLVAVQELSEDLKVRSLADKQYQEGNLQAALLLYELINTCEYFDARHNNKLDEWSKGPRTAFSRLFEIPYKLVTREGGARDLEDNLAKMEGVAGIARRVGYDALMRYYLDRKNFKSAMQFGEAALDFSQLEKGHKPFASDVEVLCLYAWATYLNGDQELAEERVTYCVEQAQLLESEEPKLMGMAQWIAVQVLSFNKPAEAQKFAEVIANAKSDDPSLKAQLASLYARQGKLSEAVKAWNEALTLYEQKHDSQAQARLHLDAGRALAVEKSPEFRNLALSHLEKSLSIYRAISDEGGLFDTEVALGRYYTSANDRTKALLHFRSAETLASQLNKDPLKAMVLSEMGEAYAAFDDPNNSLQHHTRAAEIYRRLRDPGAEAQQLQFVGYRLEVLQRKDEALESFTTAKHLADKTSLWWRQYWSRQVLASAYESRGEYMRAIDLYRESKLIAETGHHQSNSAWSSYSLAWSLANIGEWEGALEEGEASLAIAREIHDKKHEFTSLTLLMNVYGDRRSGVKDLTKAMHAYEEAKAAAALNPSIDLMDLSDTLLEIHMQMGRFDDAVKFAQEAVGYYQKQKDERSSANALMGLSEAYRKTGNFAAAAKALDSAEPLVKKLGDLYSTGRLYYSKAGLARANGHLAEAVELYEKVIESLELLKSRAQITQQKKIAESYSFLYDELIEALHALWEQRGRDKSLSYPETALEYGETIKARDFSSSWGNTFVLEMRRLLPAEIQERERSIVSKREKLSAELENRRSESTSSAAASKLAAELNAVNKDLESFVKELGTKYSAYSSVRFPKSVTLQSVPLRPEETLLVFKMTDEATFVWFARRINPKVEIVAFYKVPFERSWFESRILRVREALNSAQPDALDPLILEQLYKALFPVEGSQELLAAKSLVIVPDGVLFLVPLEMLSPSASSSEYPLVGTAITYYPSVGSLELARAVSARGVWSAAFIGVGDPIISAEEVPRPEGETPSSGQTKSHDSLTRLLARGLSLKRLPSTAIEIQEVAKLFSETDVVDIRLGSKATKKQVLETDLRKFRFIHFATHGFLPVGSGLTEPALAFSSQTDNPSEMLLQMSEVLQLSLNADMVVLSACNTGSGRVSRAEGVANLGRAFMLAGASSAVVSLWQVADNSTAILMQGFYRGLLKGRSKAQALAEARSALQSKGYTNPFFWAPFVLMGE